MTIPIRLFAAARDLVGQEVVELPLQFPFLVSELRRVLGEEKPELTPILSQSRFAVDLRYVEDHATISTASEIVLILPVSGG